MSFKNERVFVLIAILCCTFGCKGAGGLFRVAGAVAVTAARVAVVTAAASHAQDDGPAPVVVVAAPVEPERCVELRPGLDAPPAARALRCDGRVLVQDGETGRWQEVRVE